MFDCLAWGFTVGRGLGSWTGACLCIAYIKSVLDVIVSASRNMLSTYGHMGRTIGCIQTAQLACMPLTCLPLALLWPQPQTGLPVYGTNFFG